MNRPRQYESPTRVDKDAGTTKQNNGISHCLLRSCHATIQSSAKSCIPTCSPASITSRYHKNTQNNTKPLLFSLPFSPKTTIPYGQKTFPGWHREDQHSFRCDDGEHDDRETYTTLSHHKAELIGLLTSETQIPDLPCCCKGRERSAEDPWP